MFLTLLHFGDLTWWELLLILAVWALVLLAFVGLPLCLIVYVVYKLVGYQRDV